MHKSYQSVLPNTNKLLKKRWDDTYYNEHRKRVEMAGPVVNTNPPPAYIHLHLKLKKQQIEEERLATIERDNRILLEKMSTIMRTKGRVDNRNDYEYKRCLIRKKISIFKLKNNLLNSLNREKRSRELLRVMNENQEILRRITSRKPQYDHMKWEQDWNENLRYMDSISAYPKDWWKQTSKSSSPTFSRQPTTMSQRSSQKKSKKKSASSSAEKDL
ncbi:DgyrCDS10527 [Dimorphilus gyrociliatus]|uniref:DgyrCDS10527 n=1 Tax=Dimorphilus gyrociliatus TaxID=2664684 RepID=A0A7I8W1V8_9ANNE|nr:DgyrCDS10527 [Dimorphilus gyrociliatus]